MAAVADHRGRPIKLLAYDLEPGAPSGIWLKRAATDVIVYDSNAGPQQRAAIISHELAHMLLDHEPAAELDLSVLAPTVDPDVAARFITRHGYADDVEADAERVATNLVTELARHAHRHALGQDNISARLR